jgi:ribonuclease BN (tRNA processing enzyme)
MKWYGKYFKVGILFSRAGIATQILLSAGNDLFLVDTGDGTLRDLIQQNIDLNRIKAIFFTHGHADHVSGLFAVLSQFRNMERMQKVEIVYPEGTTSIAHIIQAFKKSISQTLFSIGCQQISTSQTIQVSGITMKAYQMTHYAAVGHHKLLYPDIAMGYRFSFEGESIAITGDTGLCQNLKDLVKGVDIALIDSTLQDFEVTEERVNKLHLSEQKAREIGKLCRLYIPIHSSSPESNSID